MRMLLIACMMSFPIGMLSAPITPEQALGRLSGKGILHKASQLRRNAVLSHTEYSKSGKASVYIFNSPESGYLVLSADDTLIPLLGYSETGTFDAENMPPQMQWWLDEYARQVTYMSALGGTPPDSRKITGEAVGPLMNTKWDQGAPYWNMCPIQGDKHCYTGCVATAMAQVMKYFNYPERASGYVKLYTSTGTLKMDLAEKPLQWDKMLDSYSNGYTQEEADAVAYLMKACGYACEMNYSTEGSGAKSIKATAAMVDNFGYSKDIRYCQRSFYSSTQWEKLIYENLKNVGPVLMGGQSLSVGHEFVCDGYDGNGYFHFNWGWSGMSDGWFLLDALNPESLGDGGGTGGGYNFSQDAIIGIKKPGINETMSSKMSQYGSLTAKVAYGAISFGLIGETQLGWFNLNPWSVTVKMGAKFEPIDGVPGNTRYEASSIENMKFASLSGFSENAGLSTIIPTDLASGKYKVTLCSRNALDENSEWEEVACAPDCSNFVIITKKTDNSYTVESNDIKMLSIDNAKIVGPLYFNMAAKFSITVKNVTDTELRSVYMPVLLTENGTIQFVSEGVAISAGSGETVTKEFICDFYSQNQNNNPTTDTEYILSLYNPETQLLYDYRGIAKMLTSVPKSDIGASLKIIGSEETGSFGSEENVKYTLVSDKTSIPFTSLIRVENGFFAYQTCLAVAHAGETSILGIQYLPIAVLNSGEEQKFSGTFNFSQGEENKDYNLILCAINGNKIIGINSANFRISISSEVSEIGAYRDDILRYDRLLRCFTATDDVAVIEVYDLNGNKIETISGESLKIGGNYSGVAIAVARYRSGETRTLKIIL